jgi:cyclopropane fatty-acyl-phospholipid synthase-like methyltransferase
LLREQGIGFRRQERSYRGALFEPTPQPLVDHGLRLADVGPNDVFYDLGCGDGNVVLTAAKKFGARAVGVDINPRLISAARSSARKLGVQHQVDFILQDATEVDLSRATVVWLFVGPEGNLRLMERLKSQLRPGARVVSVAFQIAGWPPDKQEFHTLPDGDSKPLFLWRI